MAQFRGAGVCPHKCGYGLEKLHHRSDEHAYGRALRNKQRIRLAVEQVFADYASVDHVVNTAGGVVQGWRGRATIELQGGVRAERLSVTVLPELGAPLLGMDLLSKLRVVQQDGVLSIEAPRP